MRLGSLCTGIGGLDLAAEAFFGCDPVWFAEWEDAPAGVIHREWPGVPNLRDLTAVDWQQVEPVDVLTAGYPCQPFSHAGKRKGKDDERHLWPYIAEAVRVLRPRWVVLENVAGHLTLGFGDVLRDLAEAGFDAEWCVLRASDVGAPHQRARLFIVARDADGPGLQGHGRSDGDDREVPARHVPAEAALPTPTDPGGERHGGGQDSGAVGRVDRGDAGAARQRQRAWEVAGDRSDAAPADADQAGPQGPQSAGRRDVPAGRGGSAAADASGGGRGGWPEGDEPAMGSGDGLSPEWGEGIGVAEGGAVAWGQYAPAIRRWEHTLGRPAPRPTDDAGRLSPAFVEWMMGYPAGWVDGLSRTQALKALGNAVVPQQGFAALRELISVASEVAA